MQSSRLLVALGLSVTGITAALFYLLFRKDEETDHEGVQSSRPTVIKVKVPTECIGTVIGRGGANVKAIQEKSKARINCTDEVADEKFRVVTIRGTPESAQLAESMIHEIILNQPLTITHEMWVPNRACGRIIGKGGETIRSITRQSCARIVVDSSGEDRDNKKRVVLHGTAEQIALAQSLIEEKVEEDADLRRRVENSFANRSPRREPKDNLNYLMAPADDQDDQPCPVKTEKLNLPGSEGFLDVFVSALENPGQFWVQLVSHRGVELDQLVDNMTDFYSKPENQEIHALREISVGQIVAAPFEHDEKWYRAEILEIKENEYDSAESEVTLYYGDYGDTCVMKRKQLFDLRTDFLSLYFQAIECILAHVKPSGDTWSDEATDLFEELAQVAQWRRKSAHVVTYRDDVHKKGQRSGSPVPVIELLDVEKNINVGEELVKKGLAMWENSSPPPSTSDAPKFVQQSTSNTSSNQFSAPQKHANPSEANSSLHKSEASGKNVSESGFQSVSKLTNGSKSQAAASSSLLQQERASVAQRGFKPKTLETSKKKKASQKLASNQAVFVAPERFSSDDDEEGFTLE